MELTRPSIIKEPISDVAVLLEFEQRNSSADCVDRAGRNENEISAPDRSPIDQRLDRTVERRRAELVLRNPALQPEAEPCPRHRVDDGPALALAFFQPSLTRFLVIGMDLDRKALAGEDIFGEQRQVAAARKPHLSDAFAGRRAEHRRQVGPAPRLFDVKALELHARRSRPNMRPRIGSITLAIAS